MVNEPWAVERLGISEEREKNKGSEKKRERIRHMYVCRERESRKGRKSERSNGRKRVVPRRTNCKRCIHRSDNVYHLIFEEF